MSCTVSKTDLRTLLDSGLERLGFNADAGQCECMVDFIALLDRWNRAYNLTAVRDPLAMVPRHLLDSLSVSPYLHGTRILDVGTGAGLPGIPLAVLESDREFHLLDSNGKKTRFVRQAVLDLRLTNVTVIQSRMESYLPAEKFATIVSRAVTSPAELLHSTHSLLASPGRLLIMKGRRPDHELGGLEPHPDAVLVHPLEVPFLDGERHVIELRYH